MRASRAVIRGSAIVLVAAAASSCGKGCGRTSGTQSLRDDTVACPPGMVGIRGWQAPGRDHPPFCLDVSEVTAARYDDCVRRGGCSDDGTSCGPEATFRAPGKEAHPVTCVSFEQAQRFCAAERKRLPSLAELEWAAENGGEQTRYPWGNQYPETEGGRVCWKRGHGFSDPPKGTCAAGQFPAGASSAGVMDLSGNVWEWAPGPDGKHTIHGGGWTSFSNESIGARWPYAEPPVHPLIERSTDIGFRCAAEARTPR